MNNILINKTKLNRNFTFNSGEVQVRLEHIDKDVDTIIVDATIKSSDDLVSLLLVDNAISNSDFPNLENIVLNLLYLPFSRQDRVCFPGEAISANVMLDLLLGMNFDRINVADVHSEQNLPSPLFLEITQLDIFKENTNILKGIDLLVSPDHGAVEKTKEIGDYFSIPVINTDKTRDTDTGYIKSTILLGDTNIITGANILIPDDICDGGITFILLAKELIKLKPNSLSLYITHGIFSKGLSELYEYFDNIITTNSFIEEKRIDKEELKNKFSIITLLNDE